MAYEQIAFTTADGVARITLNRPDRLNSFTRQMHAEVREALAAVAADTSARALVLTGAGRGFCAGQDLSDRAVSPGDAPVDLGESIERDYMPLVQGLRALPVPVVCAVNGVAAGAGANIALACDIVVAARSASFIQAFCRIGLVPDSGGTWFLPRLVGGARAAGLALLGDKLPAEQAASWGLIWQCVDDGELAPTVERIAAQLAQASPRGLAAIKRALQAGAGNTLDAQLALERDLQRELGFGADYREGVAAFLAKRAPRFRTADAMAEALPREALVAVVGAGAMGAGIAQVAAQAGHRVLLHDARPGAAADAQRALARTFDALASKGKLTADDARAAAGRVQSVAALRELAPAALVIEAIVEDLGAKRDLFAELEAIVADDAILATNTSSLSVTALAAGLRRPGRVVGMHFFNPAPVLPLVEVVSGLATDPAVAATVHATAAAWGKSPVHAASTPGFIVNRCARPFYAEALRLLAERAADAATLDAVMRDAGGFRMGPFELMDLVGHDVNFAVTSSVFAAYFGDPRFRPSVIQRELVDAGYLGRKAGRGFYDHRKDAPRPAVAEEPAGARPAGLVVHGDLGPARALVPRWRAAGVTVDEQEAVAAFPDGVVAVAGAWLALSDGRTATARAAAVGAHRLTLLDYALDFATCTRVAVAVADTCDAPACAATTGALQAAGLAVARLDDVAGLAVLRTVAMLANEAAEAVTQGVATPADLDDAMRKGVNYPRGPLAWADAIGVARVRDVLANLAAHYGEDRYRVAPLIARRAITGQPLAGGTR